MANFTFGIWRNARARRLRSVRDGTRATDRSGDGRDRPDGLRLRRGRRRRAGPPGAAPGRGHAHPVAVAHDRPRPRRAQRAPRPQAARRRAALARLAGVRTVGAALRRAWLTGAIDRATLARHRAAYAGARKAMRRADRVARAEEGAVLASVERLAADGRLTPSRLPGRLPQPAPEHPHVDAGARSRRGRAADVRRRPRRLPVRARPRDPVASARQLGPGQRAPARVPAPAAAARGATCARGWTGSRG